ncbi:hypothetical protein [Synechococcus sp. 1G10]|uniref:hypothetical protein n=1 Tax=Synechococcus sp. 1G10 TaxID=2025605 RepID=UPI00117F5D1F|nr:hypothetical protein [Synechococcus sp. 1G10]
MTKGKMASLLMIGATVVALYNPKPAKAGTVLPTLFAERYCTYRDMGASFNDAINQASDDSTISSNSWFMLPSGVRSDIKEASGAAVRRCPQYNNK